MIAHLVSSVEYVNFNTVHGIIISLFKELKCMLLLCKTLIIILQHLFTNLSFQGYLLSPLPCSYRLSYFKLYSSQNQEKLEILCAVLSVKPHEWGQISGRRNKKIFITIEWGHRYTVAAARTNQKNYISSKFVLKIRA
jgi:hypothetical protein